MGVAVGRDVDEGTHGVAVIAAISGQILAHIFSRTKMSCVRRAASYRGSPQDLHPSHNEYAPSLVVLFLVLALYNHSQTLLTPCVKASNS